MKKKWNDIQFNARTNLYLAGVGIMLIILLIVFYLFAPVSHADSTVHVCIDDDDTQDSVIVKLNRLEATHGLTGLKMLMRHSNYRAHVRTGRYAIEPGDGALRVFRHIKNGQQQSMSLVIPEARTADRLAALLAQRIMLDSATIARALLDSAACRQLGYDTCTITAMFVPNTYDVYWNMGIETLLQRMKKEHDRFWQGSREEKAQQLGLTPNEVCTLASIIDEETSNNAEKPVIAGMYLNRLRAKMPLQADPTVKFALRQFELRRIYHNQLQTDSPYNTYRYEGLPPGPIKVASIRGIDAVLNAVSHNYLYMCAKEDFSGTHNFARTYQEHLQNAARYTRALNERGVK